MGKIPQGILGGVSGKVGGVVGSSWKGINVIKTKPLSVANPKTSGQIAQRSKFTNAVTFAQVILANTIKPLWDRFASRMSGFNDFIATNIAEFENPLPADPASILTSKGVMGTEDFDISPVLPDDTTVTITWTSTAGVKFKAGNDLSNEVGAMSDDNTIIAFPEEVERTAETIVLDLPRAAMIGEKISIWLSFKRADGTIVSNSVGKQVSVGG